MPASLQPLVDNQKIVTPEGLPTPYFIRWAQARQIDISGAITLEQVQQAIDDWAAEREIFAGIGLSGGGTLDADVMVELDASIGLLNDVDLSTPPTDGQVLVWDDAAQKWVPADQSGGGGGGSLQPKSTDWRIRAVSRSDDPSVGWGDIVFATSGGPVAVVTPYASTTYSGTYPASNAFDGNPATAWYSLGSWNVGESVGATLASNVAITSVTLTAPGGYPQGAPLQFAVDYKDSGTWRCAGMFLVTGWVNLVPVTVTIPPLAGGGGGGGGATIAGASHVGDQFLPGNTSDVPYADMTFTFTPPADGLYKIDWFFFYTGGHRIRYAPRLDGVELPNIESNNQWFSFNSDERGAYKGIASIVLPLTAEEHIADLVYNVMDSTDPMTSRYWFITVTPVAASF